MDWTKICQIIFIFLIVLAVIYLYFTWYSKSVEPLTDNSGLTWTSYDGYHGEDPSFDKSKPLRNGDKGVSTGVITDFLNLDSATNGNYPNNRNTHNFSVLWTGFFYTKSYGGKWNFSIASDDGSYVWIGDNAASGYTRANATVDNGDPHGQTTKQADINLTADTYYPIRIIFGEIGGGYDCNFRFTPPGQGQMSNGDGFFFTSRIASSVNGLPSVSNKLLLWFDASDTSTISYNGSNVSVWKDKSGNKSDATPQLGNCTYDAVGFNGKPSVRFNNSALQAPLAMGTFPAGSGITVLTAYYCVNDGGWGVPFTRSVANVADPIDMYNGSRWTGNAGAYSAYGSSIDLRSLKTPCIYDITVNAKNWTENVNGGSQTWSTSFDVPFKDTQSNKFFLGGRWDNVTYLNGYISETIVYSGVMSATDLKTVEGYLAWKWGVQTSLPSGHPYKSAAPTIAGGDSSGFTSPKDITSGKLIGWYDFSDASSLQLSGAGVSQCADKSGSSNNLSQTNASYQPTIAANAQNGLSTLNLNGSSQILFNSTTVFPKQNYSVFAICRLTNTSGDWHRLLNGGAPGQDGHLLFGTQGQTNCDGFGGGGWTNLNNNITAGSGVTVTNVWMLKEFINAGGATGGKPFITGVAQDPKDVTGTVSFTGFSLGGHSPGVQHWGGNIGEVLIYDAALSTTDRQKIEGSLAWKWGLQTNLPDSHPYKKAAPSSGGASSGGFTSSSVPGMVLWLDATDPQNNGTLPSNGNLTKWSDKSGTGNDGKADGGVEFNSTGFNGKPTFNFKGPANANNFFVGNSNISTDKMTVFAVCSMNSSSPFAARVIGFSNGNGVNDFPEQRFVGILRQSGTGLGPYRAGNYIRNDSTTAYSTPYVWETWYDGSTQYSAALTGGNTTINKSACTGNFGITYYAIGNNPNFGDMGAAAMNGQISEIIVYNTCLTDEQRQKVESYLSWKWGLQDKIPSNNAFKSANPFAGAAAGSNTGSKSGGPITVDKLPNFSGMPALWAAYSAEKWNSATNVLPDLTSNARDATTSGVTLGTASGNGATGTISYLDGNTSSRIIWPAGSIPTTFTICSLTRYNGGGGNGRIMNSSGGNWLHGHWGGQAGVCHYDGWRTPSSTVSSVSNVLNWTICTGTNSTSVSTPNNVIVNGVGVGNTNGGGVGNGILTINPFEQSTFQFSQLFIWDSALTAAQMLVANNFMKSYLDTGSSVSIASYTVGDKSGAAAAGGDIVTALQNYYKFNASDVAGNTVKDYGSGSAPATLTSGSTISTTQSKFGGASLNVTSGNGCTLPAYTFDGNKGMTIAFWSYINGYTAGQPPFCMKYTQNATIASHPGQVLRIWYGNFSSNASPITRFVIDTDSTDVFLDGTSVPIMNTWVHQAYVVSANKLTLYVNGNLYGSINLHSPLQNLTYASFSIGSDINYNGTLQGFFDEFRVYNRQLTASDVTAVYNSDGSSTAAAPADSGYVTDGIILNLDTDIANTTWKDTSATKMDYLAYVGTGLTNITPTNPVNYVTKQVNNMNVVVFDSSKYNFAYNATGISTNQIMTVGFTYDMWVYPIGSAANGTTGATYNGMILMENGQAGAIPANGWCDTHIAIINGYVCTGFWNGGPQGYVKSTSTINLNTWYHIVETWDAKTQKLSQYLNGELQTNNPYGTTFARQDPGTIWLSLGIYFNAGYFNAPAVQPYWNGYMGPVKFYARPFTAAEVTQNYKIGYNKLGISSAPATAPAPVPVPPPPPPPAPVPPPPPPPAPVPPPPPPPAPVPPPPPPAPVPPPPPPPPPPPAPVPVPAPAPKPAPVPVPAPAPVPVPAPVPAPAQSSLYGSGYVDNLLTEMKDIKQQLFDYTHPRSVSNTDANFIGSSTMPNGNKISISRIDSGTTSFSLFG